MTGFVNNDGPEVVSGQPVLSTVAGPTSSVWTYPITPVLGTLAASNDQFDFVEGILAITMATQAIRFAPIAPVTAETGLIPQEAPATFGLPVQFWVIAGPAQLISEAVLPTGSGTVVIEATQAGDGNFLPAPPVRQSFAVTAIDLLAVGGVQGVAGGAGVQVAARESNSSARTAAWATSTSPSTRRLRAVCLSDNRGVEDRLAEGVPIHRHSP